MLEKKVCTDIFFFNPALCEKKNQISVFLLIAPYVYLNNITLHPRFKLDKALMDFLCNEKILPSTCQFLLLLNVIYSKKVMNLPKNEAIFSDLSFKILHFIDAELSVV